MLSCTVILDKNSGGGGGGIYRDVFIVNLFYTVSYLDTEITKLMLRVVREVLRHSKASSHYFYSDNSPTRQLRLIGYRSVKVQNNTDGKCIV